VTKFSEVILGYQLCQMSVILIKVLCPRLCHLSNANSHATPLQQPLCIYSLIFFWQFSVSFNKCRLTQKVRVNIVWQET